MKTEQEKEYDQEKESSNTSTISKQALVEATFRKLPFLSAHFNIKNFDKTSFRRINAQVLTIPAQEEISSKLPDKMGIEIPADSFADWGTITVHNTIILFAKTGLKMGQVGVKNVLRKRWLGNRVIIETRFEETIGEALERLRSKETESGCEIYYAIGSLWKETSHLIISKPATPYSLKHWLEKEAEEADKQIASQLPPS